MKTYCKCEVKGCGALTFYAIEPKVCPRYCKDCKDKEVREQVVKEAKELNEKR